jgi:hypothetical protein
LAVGRFVLGIALSFSRKQMALLGPRAVVASAATLRERGL